MKNTVSKKLASFSFLFLARAFISLTLFNAYEPTRHITITLFLVLTLVLYYPLRLIISNKKLSMNYQSLVKDKDASSLIMFYIKLPIYMILVPFLTGGIFLIFMKTSEYFSINARLIILGLGAFVLIFLFWTFLGNRLLHSRDTIARLYKSNRIDQKLGYHILVFMIFFSLTSNLSEALVITLLFSFLIFDLIFGLHQKSSLKQLLIENGLFLLFKFTFLFLVSLITYKYLGSWMKDELNIFILWLDPKVSVIVIYLFLYLISGVGNYVQLNLLISYLVKKPSKQVMIVWILMGFLYAGLTVIHMEFNHFNEMKQKILHYQQSI